MAKGRDGSQRSGLRRYASLRLLVADMPATAIATEIGFNLISVEALLVATRGSLSFALGSMLLLPAAHRFESVRI